ncbi:ATP-binding protein [Candidatus Villigracilis affinis]|uniref:ATP-binding protein n=1 Tax=Candidatus Villigracilis affinis TaxID=3140682 RepID=UPI001D2E0B30|nr:hypothetical protein [Anaerolineales bacterium]
MGGRETGCDGATIPSNGTQPSLPACLWRSSAFDRGSAKPDRQCRQIHGRPDFAHIEIGQAGEDNGRAIFFVRDNGIGIDPEHRERIFGLFNKLDAKSEGTGVGLAL